MIVSCFKTFRSALDEYLGRELPRDIVHVRTYLCTRPSLQELLQPCAWLVPRLSLRLADLATPCAARIKKASIVDDSRNGITLSRPIAFTLQKAFLQFNVTNAAIRWTDDDHAQESDCCRLYLASPVYDTLDVEPDGKCWQENDTAGFHLSSLATFSDFKEQLQRPTVNMWPGSRSDAIPRIPSFWPEHRKLRSLSFVARHRSPLIS